jgi:isoleucyl-tRNA synthetase
VKANFKRLGPRLGADVQLVATALEKLDPDTSQALTSGESTVVAGHEISAEDVIVQRVPRPGMVVAAEGPLSVAIDTTVTPELEIEGTARELINRIQQLRRDRGFAVADRILVDWLSTSEQIRTAFETYPELIAAEVLAVAITERGEVDGTVLAIDGDEEVDGTVLVIDGDEVVIAISRSES